MSITSFNTSERTGFMVGSHTTGYIKFLKTPRHIGFGIDLDFEDGDGWEFTLHLLCFQVWIGA